VDDNGFLSDPESTIGGVRWSNVDALTIGDLRQCRTVVLLGEPGMGKSTFLAEARPLLPENCGAADDHHNLAEYGSEDRLVRSVFESQRVEKWLAGTGELCLTLDGFDDAQTRNPSLGFVGRRVFRPVASGSVVVADRVPDLGLAAVARG
jgi:ABC-type taurine transport system ATPase subunit